MKDQINHKINDSIYEKLVLNMNEALWMGDKNEKTLYANPKFCDLVELNLNEIIGRYSYIFWDRQSSKKVKKENETKRKLGLSSSYTGNLLSKSGKRIPVLISGTSLSDGGTIGIMTDLRELKKKEKKIRNLNLNLEKRVRERTRELEIANRELESFSYSVSHDLRAPLRSISGFSSILLEDYGSKLDQEAQNYLNRIFKSTKKLESLIDDLLSLSKVVRSSIHKEIINLSEIVTSICDDLQLRDPKRSVQFEIEQNIMGFADGRLMKIALTNLLENAYKYTSKKKCAHICFGSTTKNKLVSYFIKDNGVGFNPEYKEKIFEVFCRLHDENEFEGTGIGLSTVLRIIEHHGGKIWTQSSLNNGATFYFTLS